MSYYRYNVSATTQNFTGVTTAARIYSTSLFIGSSGKRKIQDLAAHIVATSTMTSATMKTQWQGSNDNTTWVDVANNAANAASTAFLTGGTGLTATIGIEAPQGAYSYRYARLALVWTSTTAGTTNDVATFGLNYRQLDV
jgi:hypothetical protein